VLALGLGIATGVVRLIQANPRTTAGAARQAISESRHFTTVDSSSAPKCPECAIRLLPIGRFGQLRDSILLRDIPIVARDSRNRFYATVYGAQDHELILYNSDGTIVRTIGRPGRGPGEFRSIWDILVTHGDTLFVGHDSSVSQFDPTGTLIQTIQFESPEGLLDKRLVAVTDSEIIVTQASISDSLKYAFYGYARNGRYLRGFGPSPLLAEYYRRRGKATGMSPLSGMRIAGFDTAGKVWLAGDGGYRLQLVDLNGRIQRVIGVMAPLAWDLPLFMTAAELEVHVAANQTKPLLASPPRDEIHPGRRRPTERRPEARPRTVLRDVAPLEPGYILVLVHVAATRWQDARVQLDTTRYSVASIEEPGYMQQLYDTILDIVDARTGEVIARSRQRGTFYLTNEGTLFRPTVSEIGVISVQAFDVVLDRTPVTNTKTKRGGGK
jgi:hypothetical protein